MKTKDEIKDRIKELEETIVPLQVELSKLKLELRDIEFEENKSRVREICDILFAEDSKANIVLLGARRGNFDGDRGVHVCDEYELFEELQFKSRPKEKYSSNRWADTLYLDGNNDALF